MMHKLEIYNIDREPVAVLQNAFDVQEEQNVNALWYLDFKLPASDSKNEFCLPYRYVRIDNGELYRLFPSGYGIDTDDMPYNSYHCEHVLANLLDKTMPGIVQVGGYYQDTRAVLEYLLSKQDTQDWVLDKCDFNRKFEYGFEKENLLAAIFSIPRCFNAEYIWRTDTSKYPWKLSLLNFDTNAEPKLHVRYGYNRLSYDQEPDYENHVTKLYAYGSGEGVNQLNIKSMTDGKGYILADAAHIAKYGIRERIWVDRRYDNVEALYGAAQRMLQELQDPVVTYSCGFIGNVDVGDMVDIIGHETTYVTKKKISYGDIDDISYELANKRVNIAQTIADLSDRQRIETTYSQGATNIYAIAYVDNADSRNALDCQFYIPAGMRFVNKVVAKITMDSFRAYSATVSTTDQESYTSASGGASSSTSSSGGESSSTSSSGGYSSRSTSSGGGTTESSTSNKSAVSTSGISRKNVTATNSGVYNVTGSALKGDNKHTHSYTTPTKHTHDMQHTHDMSISSHTHDVTFPSHRHTFETPSHSHQFSVPSHTHSFSVPDHTHTVTIPGHKHTVEPGIFRFGYPNAMYFSVNGASRGSFTGTSTEIDITDWLLNADGNINRGSWYTFSVRPNALAHISVVITILGFIQSMEGGTY